MDTDVMGGTPPSAPAPSQPSTPAPSPAPASEPVQSTPAPVSEPSAAEQQPKVIASGGQEGGNKFELVQDPVTGRRSLRYAQPQQQAPQEPDTLAQDDIVPDATPTSDQAEQAVEELNAAPVKYTLDEFSSAIASGFVDGDRVPDEYKAQYADFKIKQAMQAYNEKVRKVEEQRQQVERQLSPEEQQAALKEFYTKLKDSAKERAMKDLGVTAERLEEMDLEGDEAGLEAFKTAYDWHRQQLINEVQQKVGAESAAKQAQQEIYRGIMQFVESAKAQEPNFNAIDQIMQTRYKTLPYEQGRAAEDAINALKAGNITEAQTEVLRKYYEDVRREYYAEKNKISTTPTPVKKAPPVVENAFGATQAQKPAAPNYSDLRNATSLRERKAWLSNFFNSNKPR